MIFEELKLKGVFKIEKLVFDDDLRNKFGARSRNIVLNEFSEKVVCKKTLDFYHEVVL